MKNRILIGLCLLSLLACEPPQGETEVRQSVIEEQVVERLALHRATKTRVCQEKVLAEASRLADSILIHEARLERDSLDKPPKPFKPDKPEIKTLIDSVPIKPFFRDTTLELIDSLGTKGN